MVWFMIASQPELLLCKVDMRARRRELLDPLPVKLHFRKNNKSVLVGTRVGTPSQRMLRSLGPTIRTHHLQGSNR